jgi:hypothetical protein
MKSTHKLITKIEPGSQSIEDIIEKYNIDTNIWYVESFKLKDGKYQIAAAKRDQDLEWKEELGIKGNTTQIMSGYSKRFPEFIINDNKVYSIELIFKRLPIEFDILESFKDLIKTLPNIKVENKKRRSNIFKNGIAAEITTFDAHLGKLASEIETGYRNYDLDIAIKDYKYATDNNLDLITPHKPEKIIYIIGQDLYHIDNMASHTTNGQHSMDVDGRITKIHQKTFIVSRDNIYKCSLLAPVEVIWIPGNHDFLASYMLAFALKQYFKDDKRISVDVTENPKKARLWGNLLVGWTHRIVGKHTVWSNELAQQFKELWGKSVFREWHHGDQHTKKDVKITPIFTSGGVTCRQITALSPVDKWHSDNVFTDAIPGGESFLWSKDIGVFANFITWTSQYNNSRNKIVK